MFHTKWKQMIIVVAAFFILCTVQPVNAEANVEAAEKTVTYESRKVKIKWSWDYFSESAQKIKLTQNLDLAIAGLILSGNAEKKDNGAAAIKTLETLGFDEVESDGYKNNAIFYPGMVFGLKRNAVGNKTVVCAIYRGTKSLWDGISNLGSQAEGFSIPGNAGHERLNTYLKKHGLNREDVILFITGHSYGAAVGSQVAQKYCSKSERKSTFAYLYATPNNMILKGKNYGDYKNIINYVNVDDGVPYVPLGNTFGKLGRTFKFDYGKQLNKAANRKKQARFDLAYRFMRDKFFAYDKSPFRDHDTYTYMSFLLCQKSNAEIIHMFNGEPQVKAPRKGKNGKVNLTVSMNSIAQGTAIYYATKKNGKYRRDLTIRKSGTERMTGLKNGKTYYFKARSLYTPKSLRTVMPVTALTQPTVYSKYSKPVKVQIVKKKNKPKELKGYYRKPYNKVIKKFRGGKKVNKYAEYNQYRYKGSVTFYFPKPVAVQSKSPTDIIQISGKKGNYSLFGITVGMKKATALKKLKKAGFKKDFVNGNYYYFKGSNYRQILLEAGSKVKSIRYGAW